MASIFLSYAREDAPQAKALAKCLEAAGHAVWWDRHIHGGSDYSDEIEMALHRSDAVLVMWSEASIRSQWVRDEAAVGRDSGRLVPVLLDDSAPPLGFRQLQSIAMVGWSGRGRPPNFESVLTALQTRPLRSTPKAEPKVTEPARRRRLFALAIALCAAILVAGAWYFLAGNRPSPLLDGQKVSLAVLPFTDLSPARDKSFFAEGVAEEILGTLAAEPGIKVLGRTSARQIERNPDPKAIRRSLGITHMLEGSMRTAGNDIRVNVRLVDTKDGAQIWQEEYQGQLGDVFAVQDQIAATVVQRLRGTFGQLRPHLASTRTRPAAYQDYLAARALTRTRTRASLSEALVLAKRVVAAAPDYAPGHALLAQLYFHLSNDPTAYGTIPVATARRLARPRALKAIRLAPESADGYASLGLVSLPADSIEPLKRAIELNPSRAEPRQWLGIHFNELGRYDEALEQFREAAAVEPLWAVPVNVLVQALAAAGRYDEAVATARQFESRGGSKAQVFRFLAQIERLRGNISAAIKYTKAALALDPNVPYLPRHLAIDYHLLGFREEALAVLPEELEFTREFFSGQMKDSHRLNSAKVWAAADGDMAIHALGARRDWQTLLQIYRADAANRNLLCNAVQWQGPLFVLALRNGARAREADQLLKCLESRLALESRMRARAHSPAILK